MVVPVLSRQRATIWPGGLSVMVPPPLEFDATRSEQHSLVFAVAQQPLEDSSIVTDHVQEQPEAPAFEVVLTDYPSIPVLGSPVGPDRYKLLYGKLVALARTRQPFDFSCSLTIYTSMVIERLSAPRTAESGKSIVCTIQLRKIETVLVDAAQVLADAALAGSMPVQDLGEVGIGA